MLAPLEQRASAAAAAVQNRTQSQSASSAVEVGVVRTEDGFDIDSIDSTDDTDSALDSVLSLSFSGLLQTAARAVWGSTSTSTSYPSLGSLLQGQGQA